MSRRPLGATALSVLLGCLAIAGFGNAIVWSGTPAAFDEPLPHWLAEVVAPLQLPILMTLAFAFGCTALVTAIGLWCMRSWMASAYLAWVTVSSTLFAWMLTILVLEPQAGRLLPGGLIGLAVIALLLLPYLYVKSISRDAVRAAPEISLQRP